MLNKMMVIGNLGKDPELRYLADGTAVANLSVATTEKWKDKATGEAKEATEWHRVSVFGRLAEICGEYLHKGDTAYFEGKLKTRKWTDKDGVDKYTTEIHASEMKMLKTKGGGQDDDQDDGGHDTRHQDTRQQRQDTRQQAPAARQQAPRGAGSAAGYGSASSREPHQGGSGYGGARSNPPPAQRAAAPKSGTGFDDMDDDIPF